jgi:tetratricopeptide (TPR) repeat protein
VNDFEEREVTLEEALALALENHKAGQFEIAAGIYKQILEADATNPDANHYYGLLAFQTGNNEKALALLGVAVDVAPDYAEAHNNRGLVLQQMGDAAKAVESYRAAIAFAPDFTDAYVNLGSALDDLKRYDDAIAQYDLALARHPDHVDAHNNKGLALHKLVRFEEAEAAFTEALKRDPNFTEALNNLGSTLLILGRNEEALACFEKALESNPASKTTMFNRANVLQKLGRIAEAAEDFERAGQRKSDYRVLHCLYTLGRKEFFRAKLERVAISNPTDRAVAAVSAFAAHQWDTDDPYPFCRNPLDYVRVRNILDEPGGADLLADLKDYFAEGLYQELSNQGHITQGFTSFGNLFDKPHPSLDAFRERLMKHVDAFRDENADADCTLISEWPTDWRLDAWYLKLRKGGQVDPHVHDPGWLSGTLYLNIPEDVKDNEGAIAFGLQGDGMPVLNPEYPQKICRVRTGDLVLFPASLFHRVLPFHATEERLCIAYDVIPASGN